MVPLIHPTLPEDMPDILCGPDFEELPVNYLERAEVLKEADEKFGMFYKMLEEILTLKEEEERVRQATEAAVA